MFKSLVTEVKTVHTINGEELDEAIKLATSRKFDPIGVGDVPGDDSSGFLEVTVAEASRRLADHYILFCDKSSDDKYYMSKWIIEYFLYENAKAGKIPFGNYRIKYSWG